MPTTKKKKTIKIETNTQMVVITSTFTALKQTFIKGNMP